MQARDVMMRREDLERPYRAPYATFAPQVAQALHATPLVVGASAVALVTLVLSLVLGQLAWVYVGGVGLVCVLAYLGFFAVRAALQISDVVSDWDEPNELEDVRRRRPHAGARDPELAHPEFAVTVENDGVLYLWRFRALPVGAPADADEVLVPGRPSYAALVLEERPFDPQDAARAAGQLAEAQQRAAELEAAAIAEVRRAREAAGEQALRDAETRSTAAALQHLTGQRR